MLLLVAKVCDRESEPSQHTRFEELHLADSGLLSDSRCHVEWREERRQEAVRCDDQRHATSMDCGRTPLQPLRSVRSRKAMKDYFLPADRRVNQSQATAALNLPLLTAFSDRAPTGGCPCVTQSQMKKG